jgi:hypothetical protein
MEPANGFEPLTCALRVRRYTRQPLHFKAAREAATTSLTLSDAGEPASRRLPSVRSRVSVCPRTKCVVLDRPKNSFHTIRSQLPRERQQEATSGQTL